MENNQNPSSIMNNIPEHLKREMGLVEGEQSVNQQENVQPAVQEVPAPEQPAPVQEQGTQEEDPNFISETFTALASGQQELNVKDVNLAPVGETAGQAAPQTAKKSNNPLDNIVIDLSAIEIVEKSPFQQQKDFEYAFNKKSTYQVVAVQSGYSAEMSALTMQDINNITNSNVDLYTHKRNVYQAVHAHMENTSLGKVGFTDWLKITSYHDLETLMYGIYCQTFPEKNEFTVTCGSCGKQTNIIVNNETLVETRAEALVLEKINEILHSAKTPADLVGKSLVHTTQRTALPESKIVVDIQTPSLWDHLEMLRTLDPRTVQQYADSIGTMLFIKDMYMMDVEGTLASGRPKYYQLKDRVQILSTLTKLSMKDGKHLEKVINDRIEKYAITYSVKNAKCTHCNDSLGNLPVDIETALFTLIGRERTA